MELRPYQQIAVDEVESELAFGSDKVVIEMATGAGKSLIVSELCRLNPTSNIVILVNITKLVTQLSKHLTEFGIDHSILKAGMESKFNHKAKVHIAMEQTFYARLESIDIKADIIVRDEHHLGFKGERFRKIRNLLGADSIIGLSATPYDNEGVLLDDYTLVKGARTGMLTEQGYLTPARTVIARFAQHIDLTEIGNNGDYSESEIEGVFNNTGYNDGVVEAWMKAGGKPVQSEPVDERFNPEIQGGLF